MQNFTYLLVADVHDMADMADMPGMNHSAEPTTGIQWGIILGFIVTIAIIYYSLRLGLRRLANVDLMEHFKLKSFMKSKWYPAVFQVPAFIVFGLIIFYLFRGSQDYSDNPGAILIWTFWWAILPFSFILIGRLWCAICPFAVISDFVQKYFGLKRKVPRWLYKYSYWIVDIIFIFITWFDRVYGMTEHPVLTGFIFLGILAGVIICAVLYERRTFCRYVCFLGNVAGNYSMVAPLEMKSKSLDVCKTCKEKSCIMGTPTQVGCQFSQFMPTKDGNRFCTLCANCVKACPHDNVALVLRPFGADFWKRTFVKFEESFFAKILVGIVIIQNIGMLTLWTTISSFIENITGIHNEAITFTITYFASISIPLLLMFISSYFSSKFSGEKLTANFARFGYAFIAVDLAGHLAHNLNHLLGEIQSIIAALFGLFSGEVGMIMEGSTLSPPTIKVLQYMILILGVAGTFAITYFIAKRKAENLKQAIKVMIPHIILLAALMLLNFYIFSLPMMHRAH